ncbi:MAG: S-layer homology domain-containing protein [Clostridia bacterium]|nr:S-layer homology domain-containing protein [Clostridia bacterium]
MKRYLASILTVCLLLMLFPALPIGAETEIQWPASVGDSVTVDGESYQYQGETAGGIEVHGTTPRAWKVKDGGYVLWNGSGTTVLHEVVIKEGTTYLQGNELVRAAVVIHAPSAIVLEGENKISLSATDQYLYALALSCTDSAALYTMRGDSLRIEYTGASVNKANLYQAAIYCGAKLTVDGVDITATGTGPSTNALIQADFDLTVKNSKLNLSIAQKASVIYGIKAGNLTLSDSNVTVSVSDTTTVTYGLFSGADLKTERSKVRIALTASDNAYLQGVSAWSTLKVSDSDLQIDLKNKGNTADGVSASISAAIEQSKIRVSIETGADGASGIGAAHSLSIIDSVLNIDIKASDVYYSLGDAYGIKSEQISAQNSILKINTVAGYLSYGVDATDSISMERCSAEITLSLQPMSDAYEKRACGFRCGSAYGEAAVAFSDCYLNVIGATNAIDAKAIPTVSGMTLLKPADPNYTAYESVHGATWYKLCSGESATSDSLLYVTKRYTDIPIEEWCMPAVYFVTQRGLFGGISETEFSPYSRLTRAQMMTVLARMAGADVTPAAGEVWYQRAVNWAVAEGISDGTDPNGYITREQMITMVWRYLGEPEGEGSLNRFTDKNKIDGWAKAAMEWAIEYNVISGRGDGTLDPDGSATRAETAQLLKNFLTNY